VPATFVLLRELFDLAFAEMTMNVVAIDGVRLARMSQDLADHIQSRPALRAKG
jgi:hypothetical protein